MKSSLITNFTCEEIFFEIDELVYDGQWIWVNSRWKAGKAYQHNNQLTQLWMVLKQQNWVLISQVFFILACLLQQYEKIALFKTRHLWQPSVS